MGPSSNSSGSTRSAPSSSLTAATPASTVPLENKHSDWRQRLVPIEFLDRVWLKSEDHELELEHEYGDWRSPDPDWDYMRAHNIIGRAPWNPEAYDFLRVAIH